MCVSETDAVADMMNTVTDVEEGSPEQGARSPTGFASSVLLKLRESTSAGDLKTLDAYGLEPEVAARVAGFAGDCRAGHAETSLVRSLLQQYARGASAVCADAASTAEERQDAVLRIVDLLKHDERLMRAFLELLPRTLAVTPLSSEESL